MFSLSLYLSVYYTYIHIYYTHTKTIRYIILLCTTHKLFQFDTPSVVTSWECTALLVYSLTTHRYIYIIITRKTDKGQIRFRPSYQIDIRILSTIILYYII